MTADSLSLAWKLIPFALLQTIYMIVLSGLFAYLVGLPLGICLFLAPQKKNLYKLLSFITNVGRSFPFAILMIALIPFTKWVVGTSLGTTASTVPLAVAAAPFIARLIESSLRSVNPKLLEAGRLMGASTLQQITKILLPESLPSHIQAMTLTFINLIGYSAMAGLIGGGGLGQIAIQYGYHRFNSTMMYLTVILLILLVELVQQIGNKTSSHFIKKRGNFPHV